MIVGIDLGTTNSLIGAYRDGVPQLFPNPVGSLLTPSAVSIADDGSVLVGRAAQDRLVTHPARSVAHFKRWMGSPRETILEGRSLRAEELSALVLRSLVADAEAATGEAVDEAVISVPAYFSDAQRKATRTAGEMAGIKVERLINEPTAAALAYGIQDRGTDGRFLVFDLGGGTLDISIVEIFEGVVEVHASAGDNYLGGEDFLEALITACLSDLKRERESLTVSEWAWLRRRLERLKAQLSADARGSIEFSVGGQDLQWSIDETRFAQLVDPLVQRIRLPLERALRDANVLPSALDEVVLVGGASRMPVVVRTVTRMLGRLPLRHVNPDQAIALGAAVASGLKARDEKLEEVILTDVCPHTLGIDISKRDSAGNRHDGFLLPIIPRSSTVPISREEEVWPVADEQTELLFNIYQGESPVANKNVHLGAITVPLPHGPDRAARGIRVRFTYDINGILQVELKVKATGQRHELILEQNPGTLSAQEIRNRLATLSALKIHPRDKQENLALIARAERLYEELLDAREHLQGMILEFRVLLDKQDDRRIAQVRRQFGEMLDAIEQR